MDERHEKAKQFMINNELNEAYQLYNELYLEDNNDIEALYCRALIDFTNLRKHEEQTLNDFLQISKKKSKYQLASYEILCILYDYKADYYHVIEFGLQALKLLEKQKSEFTIDLSLDVNFAIARAYFHLGDDDSLHSAISFINKCIEMDEEQADFPLTKVDILLALKDFDASTKLIQKIQTKFGTSLSLYYIKEKYSIIKAQTIIDKDGLSLEARHLLDDALDYISICERYDGDPMILNYSRVEVLLAYEKYDEAILTLSKMENKNNKEDILIEKIKVYESKGDFTEPINECIDYLKKNSSWKISYSLGYMLSYIAKNNEDLYRAKSNLEEAYKEAKEDFILYEIYSINVKLKKFEENLTLLKDYYMNNPHNGKVSYLLGITAQANSLSYDEQLNYFIESFNNEYINNYELIDEISCLLGNLGPYKKLLKQYQKLPLNSLDGWQLRKMGIRYLYGEDGYKRNFDLAGKYLSCAYEKLDDNACMQGTFGRYNELVKKDFNAAFAFYEKGYKIFLNSSFPDCNCIVGYLAHAYIKGIGVDKNINYAKELIKKAINDKGFRSSNMVIYLYCYFYLLGSSEIDPNYCVSLLKSTFAFYRLEITRFLYLKIFEKILNCDLQIAKELKEVLNYSNNNAKKYYFDNLEEKCPYPFEYNF